MDGSTLPFPVLVRSGGSTSLPGLEIAGGPDGRFGILCASGSEFQIIAADGSLAGSRVILAAALGEEADLAHDGQTWIVAGRRIVYRSSVGYAQSVVLRGETLTYAAIIQEEGIADLDAWSFSMAVQGDAIIVLWETRVYWSWPRSSLVSARLRVPSGATGGADDRLAARDVLPNGERRLAAAADDRVDRAPTAWSGCGRICGGGRTSSMRCRVSSRPACSQSQAICERHAHGVDVELTPARVRPHEDHARSIEMRGRERPRARWSRRLPAEPRA
ncbi:MAG: hypothetical protein M5U09_17710 [Gammaproteobacteria bacterium]|nr:hypothetical protein [Gammaproteobacteria bacterium]